MGWPYETGRTKNRPFDGVKIMPQIILLSDWTSSPLFPSYLSRCKLSDIDVLHHGMLDELWGEDFLFVVDLNVLKHEVAEVVPAACADIEEVVTGHLDILQRDVTTVGPWHIIALQGLEELHPRSDDNTVFRLSFDVLHRHIFILLWSVGPHLEPKHTRHIIRRTVPHDDVAVVQTLRAKGKHGVDGAVMAVLDEHTLHRSIDSHRVGIGALATLQHHGIIVDIHITAIDKKIMSFVNVDSIGTRCLDILCRGIDITAEKAHVVTAVQMVRPERTVDKSHILNRDVAGVANIHEAGTLGFLVRALRVPLPADPEFIPIVVAITINGSFARDREPIHMVGIDERREILARLTFNTCLYNLEVGYTVRASEDSTVLEMQVSTRLEEERTSEKRPGRDDHYPTAFPGTAVDHRLDGSRLQQIGVVLDTIVGNDVLFPERAQREFRCVREPLIHLGAIRPVVG